MEGVVMRPIESLIARYKNHIIKNFENTKYSKELQKLHNIHSGESCFVIGNGPSLNTEDLLTLYNNNIPTFAFNRIYLLFDKTPWRPTYYISQDEKTLKNCINEVNAMELHYKFIPINLRYYYSIKIKKANYFKMVNPTDNHSVILSDDVSRWVGNTNTVAITAIQFAVYMGFTKIFLIGVDHNFSIYTNDKGEIIKDKTAKDYFTEKYNPDQQDLYLPNIDKSTRDYSIANMFCKKHCVEVFNATRGGKLEVFPRVNFDELEF